ncbi:MAG: hypothetical protein H6Q13_177 [Bacteroidetes bacterium]|nr:hypothetical protein [Bacteroidota bacterium]
MNLSKCCFYIFVTILLLYNFEIIKINFLLATNIKSNPIIIYFKLSRFYSKHSINKKLQLFKRAFNRKINRRFFLFFKLKLISYSSNKLIILIS